jgi:hypothetical protein
MSALILRAVYEYFVSSESNDATGKTFDQSQDSADCLLNVLGVETLGDILSYHHFSYATKSC